MERLTQVIGKASSVEEALEVLGRLLRADRALKEEFVRWAEEAYRTRWTPPRPSDRGEAVAYLAIQEAINRLARQRGWRREEKAEPQHLGLTREKAQEILGRVKVGQAPQGAFKLWRATSVALKAAAKRLVSGGEVYVENLSPSLKKAILGAVAEELARRRAAPTVRAPWGEELPLFPGDRWEADCLHRPEPRLARAHELLMELVVEAEAKAEAEAKIEDTREWVHEVRPNPGWFTRAYREVIGEKLDPADLPVLIDDPVIVNELAEAGEIEYGSARVRKAYPEWYPKAVQMIRRRIPTLGEIREGSTEKLLCWAEPLALVLALQAGLRDPLSGAQEVLLLWWRRLTSTRFRLNPLLFLEGEARRLLAELRLRERGRLTDRETRLARRALALAHQGKEEEAKALLEEEGLEWILQGEVSLEEVKVREELDYDQLLLRKKVGELMREVELVFGEEGLLVMEALMEGVVSPHHPVLEYLRTELEGWVEE